MLGTTTAFSAGGVAGSPAIAVSAHVSTAARPNDEIVFIQLLIPRFQVVDVYLSRVIRVLSIGENVTLCKSARQRTSRPLYFSAFHEPSKSTVSSCIIESSVCGETVFEYTVPSVSRR